MLQVDKSHMKDSNHHLALPPSLLNKMNKSKEPHVDHFCLPNCQALWTEQFVSTTEGQICCQPGKPVDLQSAWLEKGQRLSFIPSIVPGEQLTGQVSHSSSQAWLAAINLTNWLPFGQGEQRQV